MQRIEWSLLMIQETRFFHHVHFVTSDLLLFNRRDIAMLVDHLILHYLNYPLPPFSFLHCPSHSSLPHYYLPDVLVDRIGKLANVYSDTNPQYRK
jgi:hypothetical protein